MSTRLSASQREVLTAAASGGDAGWTGPELLAHIGRQSSVQGIHQTAASLVRRGYLRKERRRIPGYGLGRAVVYIATRAGRQEATR